MNLFQNEISIIATKDKKNTKLPNITYEKYIDLETLQSFNKFFSILDTEKIFLIIQKSFEQKFDKILVKEDKMVIQLIVNFMDVVTEEIKFELQMVKLSNEEETNIIKESIRLLTVEKDNLKNEVYLLNNAIEELKKKSDEKDNEMKNKLEEKEKEFQDKIDENKKEFKKKMEEKDKENKKKKMNYKIK